MYNLSDYPVCVLAIAVVPLLSRTTAKTITYVFKRELTVSVQCQQIFNFATTRRSRCDSKLRKDAELLARDVGAIIYVRPSRRGSYVHIVDSTKSPFAV